MNPGVKLEIDTIGFIKTLSNKENAEVKRFTWRTERNMVVQVMTYGATITKILLPDKNGTVKDIVMGHDTVEGYQKDDKYFGATIGRVANRIKNGRFTLSGQIYQLAQNAGTNHLHGGIVGFDKVNWNYFVDGTKVIFSHLSIDGDENYPGDLLTQVTYNILADNTLKVTIKCWSTRETPVNLTNHSYFNLAGHDAGPAELYNHLISINGNNYTELGTDFTPTGKIVSVVGSPYDLRTVKKLGEAINSTENGYDINYCITDGGNPKLILISEVIHKSTGRFLKLYSNQPGVQFYTANFLPDPNSPDYKPLVGKDGAKYEKQGSFCLETQNYPDAINHSNFPDSVLYPGKEYLHEVEYRFGVEN